MKNTTKLKHILKLYTVTVDMDEDERFYLTMIDKRTHRSFTLEEKTYSLVIAKAFSRMMKEIKSGEV